MQVTYALKFLAQKSRNFLIDLLIETLFIKISIL